MENNEKKIFEKNKYLALKVWLSRLSAGLWNEGLPVWFPVRAHAWVVGQAPSRGGGVAYERQPHIDVSFPLFLSPSLSKNK